MQQFITVDPYARDLPADVASWADKFKSGTPPMLPPMNIRLGGDEKIVSKVKIGTVLDRWDVETHIYRKEAAAKIGFFAKLFGASGKIVKAGVTQEAKTYRVDTNEEGRQIEVGAAVRLAVATSTANIDFELSAPNLAAAAQLGKSDAKIGIYVVGYKAPLGDILPAPRDLNVENFGHFVAAFATIQQRVFGPENAQHISPTLLGYFVDDSGA